MSPLLGHPLCIEHSEMPRGQLEKAMADRIAGLFEERAKWHEAIHAFSAHLAGNVRPHDVRGLACFCPTLSRALFFDRRHMPALDRLCTLLPGEPHIFPAPPNLRSDWD